MSVYGSSARLPANDKYRRAADQAASMRIQARQRLRKPEMSYQRRNAAATICAAAIATLCLAGCAAVPHVGPTRPEANGIPIEISGTRGPLSEREAQVIVARLAAAAPNAGALERHLAVEQAVAESTLFTGNRVQVLQNGDETFPAMFAAIRGAQHYVDLEYYIFEDVSSDGVLLSDLLLAKRQAGVKINLIYDAVGSISTPADFLSRLQAAGVRIVQFNPLNPLKAKARYSINDRDHRKILIADGRLVILGGINLSASYESAPGSHPPKRSAPYQAAVGAKPQELWRDIDVEISGPIVSELEKLFKEHWAEQHGEPLGDQDAPARMDSQGQEVVRIVGSSPGQVTARYYVTVVSAIRNAEQRIWITAAYFVPTPQEKSALQRAAKRGVDVRLLLPSHSDSPPALAVQRSHYSDLLRAGIKIYERDDGILHSKTMVVDSVWSVTGSSNFDHRSVLFNDEVDAVIIGNSTGEQLEKIFQTDLQQAHGIDLGSWRMRSVGERLREQFWRIWERMF
jgi:cardiolipin synthase